MNLTFISDTHAIHDDLELTEGDFLIHCGDFTRKGSLEDVESFAKYMGKTNYKYKVVIAGNHDFAFENENQKAAEKILEDNGLVYLNDTGTEIEGLKFWGSPIQPWYHDWAFNRQEGEEIKKHWDLIPDNVDILITHGPPLGILDMCDHGGRVGCEELLKAVKRIKPKVHAFGHIHEDYGTVKEDEILFINASSLNLKYEYANKPIVIDL